MPTPPKTLKRTPSTRTQTQHTTPDARRSRSASSGRSRDISHSSETSLIATPAPRARTTPQRSVHVYIYGYCYNEGRRGSRATYGVFFAKSDYADRTKNIQRAVSLHSKQTSKVACLNAIEEVLTHPYLKKYVRNKIPITIHVDNTYAYEMLTTKGDELAAQNFPPRANHELIRRVYRAIQAHAPWFRLTTVDLQLERDRVAYSHARRLARDKLETLVHVPQKEGGEKELFRLQLGCSYDDTKRIYLNVPSYDREYALSKGAWWDYEDERWYTYGTQDLGSHYDMRRTDYLNLTNLYGS